MRNENGQFVKGAPSDKRLPVGTVRIRTRTTRTPPKRAFVKVAEPDVWVLRCRHLWEQAHGAIPARMGIHHKDGDPLNDTLSNLELVSKAEHLRRHREGHDHQKRIANFANARREQRWSTKSSTKRTGRHPKGCECPLHKSPK